MFSGSCFIEKPPVPEDLPAEAVAERSLYTTSMSVLRASLRLRRNRLSRRDRSLQCQDAEVIVAAFGVVATGPGAVEVTRTIPWWVAKASTI